MADKASVLATIARLRDELAGAGEAEVERAIDASELRLNLGDLLTAELMTVEEARAELGYLHAAVFCGVKKRAVQRDGR